MYVYIHILCGAEYTSIHTAIFEMTSCAASDMVCIYMSKFLFVATEPAGRQRLDTSTRQITVVNSDSSLMLYRGLLNSILGTTIP